MAEIGIVKSIYIASEAGGEMVYVAEASLREYAGIAGDRYGEGCGSFSPRKGRWVSLIEAEAIEAALQETGVDYTESETRRNIVTEGVELNGLVGVKFFIGRVALTGVELCTPCDRPDKLSKNDGFKAGFAGRGGLRAEVLGGGTVAIGDAVFLK